MEFLGGCMYIEPTMVNEEYVQGPNWQVRVANIQKNSNSKNWDETDMKIRFWR